MSQTVMEKLNVVELTKFGFKTDKAEYINWGPRFKGQAAVFPGVVGEFTLYVSDGGKKYVNDFKMTSVKKDQPKVEEKKAEVKSVFKAKDDTSMTKAEWSAKDRSQLIGGLSHDAAAVAVAVLNLDGSNEPGVTSALKVYKELLQGMIKIRDEVK